MSYDHRPMRFAAGLCAVIVACSAGQRLPPLDGAIPQGTWGAEGAGMTVSETGLHLHIGCTNGDVVGRVPVGPQGEFDASGSYMLRAYPVAVGPTLPARFTGRLQGNAVTISATVDDTVLHQTVIRGPVTVHYGEEARLGPCPICKRPMD
jgi:hypothetical protein